VVTSHRDVQRFERLGPKAALRTEELTHDGGHLEVLESDRRIYRTLQQRIARHPRAVPIKRRGLRLNHPETIIMHWDPVVGRGPQKPVLGKDRKTANWRHGPVVSLGYRFMSVA